MTAQQLREKAEAANTSIVGRDYMAYRQVLEDFWDECTPELILSLIYELDAARLDASRYRFLREDEHTFAVFMPRKHGHIAFLGEGLDGRIDVALNPAREDV